MRANQTAPKDIDEYIAGFPNDVQEILKKIRLTIREAAPDAEETPHALDLYLQNICFSAQ